MSNLFSFLVFLFTTICFQSSVAQTSKLLGPRKGVMFEISEDSGTCEEVDTSKAEIMFWRIETNHDKKYMRLYQNSISSERINRELEVILSCNKLRELHLLITDEVIHFPEEIRRIRELDSLIVLSIWYEDDIVVRTLDKESILTDEIEEFSYRPLDLSILRGMHNLEVFATNWNAEVHDPDALLDLHRLKYAQVPVASLQPDFFKNPNLEFVQCGPYLKLAWHRKRSKLQPWYEGEAMMDLFLRDTLVLREMEESAAKRKKPIDWHQAFVQLNVSGDTVFQLKGTGKNYSIFYQDNDDDYSNYGAKYELVRNDDSIRAYVYHDEYSYRTSITTSDGQDTSMRLTYSRTFSLKDVRYTYELRDHFVNGKRFGNYDFYTNDLLFVRRTYKQDSLIDSFSDDYFQLYSAIYHRLLALKQNVRLQFTGAITRNDSIVQITWGDYKDGINLNDFSFSVSLKDKVLNGTTYAVDINGDTVLVMYFENGIQQGRMLEKSKKDKKLTVEELFYVDGKQLYRTKNDGKYFIEFDYREGAKYPYRRTHIRSSIIVNETIFHPELNEMEHTFYDENTGEVTGSRKSKK